MAWLKRNAKTVVGVLVILILIEAVLAWYLIQQFRENYLSGDEALQIALTDADLSKDEVEDIDIDLETEHGTAWYKVEFEVEKDTKIAYEYQIDAENGTILSARFK